MLQRSSLRYVVGLYVLDMVLVALSLLLARWLRVVVPLGKALDVEGYALRLPMFLLAWLIWSLSLAGFRVYDPHRFVDPLDEIQTVVVAVAVATMAYAGALYFTYRGLSRLLYGYFFLLDVALSLVARPLMRGLLQRQRQSRRRGVLIIGAGHAGREIARSLQPTAWMGLSLVGYMDDDPAKQGTLVDGLPVLGPLDQVSAMIAEQKVHEVIIALPRAAHRRLANLVAELQSAPVNIKVVPDYADIALYRTSLEQLGGVFLIGLKEPVIGPVERLIKRLFDLAVSLLGVAILSPLLATVAMLIKIGSPGPVLYGSERMGEGGKPFKMLKFRTMVQGADRLEHTLIKETTDGKLVFDKREDDPRITPIGHFLRRFSVDELPQLFNVIAGDMSLVGPRPELPSLVAHYEPWQRKRFGVPQGMTGWWQVSGRSSKAKYLHVEDDLYYIRNYSLLLDLHIICRTLGAVIRGEGAF